MHRSPHSNHSSRQRHSPLPSAGFHHRPTSNHESPPVTNTARLPNSVSLPNGEAILPAVPYTPRNTSAPASTATIHAIPIVRRIASVGSVRGIAFINRVPPTNSITCGHNVIPADHVATAASASHNGNQRGKRVHQNHLLPGKLTDRNAARSQISGAGKTQASFRPSRPRRHLARASNVALRIKIQNSKTQPSRSIVHLIGPHRPHHRTHRHQDRNSPNHKSLPQDHHVPPHTRPPKLQQTP